MEDYTGIRGFRGRREEQTEERGGKGHDAEWIKRRMWEMEGVRRG